MESTLQNKQDVVYQLPDEIAEIKHTTGNLPDGVKLEPGYCIWNNRFFIHTRATLPLKDKQEGIGFGLWEEISKEDFDKYMAAENDDEKYLQFDITGTLANEWPGFENLRGLKVRVKTINANEKVYIWEVLDKPSDPLFENVLYMQKQDTKTKERVNGLVEAWMKDFGQKLL